jgi:Zn-dependent peptidase ImmA (M78 family)
LRRAHGIGDRGHDFRTVPGAPPPLFNPVLDALLRDIRGRQAMVRTLLEDDQSQPVDFIGTASVSDPPQGLANKIAERLWLSLEELRQQANVDQSFKYLRERIEAAGIYVLLLGNLGSYHTNISVETFRGFAIADSIAPFIIVNDQDARSAWSFTALHEVAHLWLGVTGVSGASVDAQIEKYCNDVAGEILLPAGEIMVLAPLREAQFNETVEAISNFANSRRISRAMVAYKMLRAEIISEATWWKLTSRFRDEWRASRSRNEEADAEDSGGPNYYVVKRHRLGNALIDLVRRSLAEGTLTHTKAAQLLGVKPRNVDPLLGPTLIRSGR